jgi:hypothetical protein
MTESLREMPPAVRDIRRRLVEAREALLALQGRPHTASDLQPIQVLCSPAVDNNAQLTSGMEQTLTSTLLRACSHGC